MQIDWVTTIAQVVNFLILVWLLQHFLYGPITRAMARREERILNRLEEADRKEHAAAEESERLQEKQEALDRKRDAILEKAEKDAREMRKSLEEEARETIEEQRREWRNQLQAEQKEFLRDLRLRAADHVYRLARFTLSELANAELEQQLAVRFAENLESLGKSHVDKLLQAADKSEGIRVESSLELTSTAQSRVTRAIHHIVPDRDVTYDKSDALLLGIRLVVGGQTVEWSLDRYLDDLCTAVEEKLAQAGPSPDKEAA